ncbi:MAG: hypothetical protein CVV64_17250 [Candidatus Wallbacteria bacterium HGW-Wallbacteria-1]|jgi:hypothetical protein|uniref:Uncharacterized protein n=1 Tax=Candidatus Wallbacteria bacterium HGW-Wallbacteria-1 TaxID=2013854 RepID=A0A2N1PK75_9BACT|nr:MAG: hypothetical protein CVV64_17250 [Candidatus Wallbacteria bacterium HGW-Wallbacteria-1]
MRELEDTKKETGFYPEHEMSDRNFNTLFSRYIYFLSKNCQQEAEQILIKCRISGIPHLIAKIQSGDQRNDLLIRVISKIVKGKFAPDATASQCLTWWEANKHKYIQPFKGRRARKGRVDTIFWNPYLGH